ncbi:MAG TPA: GrpB family protein [Blastocatellia bacterium]|nr:GrpB family protein [Blastocatellia bacterium]
MTEAQILAATIGSPALLNQTVLIADYDPEWPQSFAREAALIRSALGHRALAVEHVGSTSVPGLAAKPIIDILLVVANSADEAAYVPALEAAGYLLRIREPDWNEHRMLKGPNNEVNLHVFSQGCAEIERMLLFRDWLRSNPEDRQLYEQTKRELARQSWRYMQNYADAKSVVVAEIMERARRASAKN